MQHFFPWWNEPGYRERAVEEASLTQEERELMERYGLDREQIGYRRGRQASFRKMTEQEYAEDSESCFKASGECVFELNAVEERLRTAGEPVQTRHNGALEVWLPPMPGKQYVVAVDPAEGGSEGDYSAAQVVDVETGLQCAEFGAHIGGAELARLVTALAEEYNHALLAVERNGCGGEVLALIETLYHYERIYRKKEKRGWRTDPSTRPAIVGRLDAALVDTPEWFMSRKFLAECRCFVRMKDSSTGARAGTHDDRVMAMAIALAVRDEVLIESGKRKRAA